MWGLDEQGQDSQSFGSVNPTYLTTARPGGIFFEISPFKNSHHLLSNVNGYSLWFMSTLLNDTNKLQNKELLGFEKHMPSGFHWLYWN